LIIVLVPPGRGRWHTVEVRFNGRRSPSSLPVMCPYKVGQRVPFDGKVWRIAEVRP
jgi:hypothetical protein